MGLLGQFFQYKVFVDALFHLEVTSIFNLPIDNQYFTLLVNDAKGHKYTKF